MNLYNIIPATRPARFGFSTIMWAMFGNDEDGVYGERSSVDGYGPMAPRTFLQFLRWWQRNPMHNLTHQILVWKRETALVIYCSVHGWFHKHTPPNGWVSDGPQLLVQAAPAFVSWRTTRWEGYAGFRGYPGELGFALRRA